MKFSLDSASPFPSLGSIRAVDWLKYDTGDEGDEFGEIEVEFLLFLRLVEQRASSCDVDATFDVVLGAVEVFEVDCNFAFSLLEGEYES